MLGFMIPRCLIGKTQKIPAPWSNHCPGRFFWKTIPGFIHQLDRRRNWPSRRADRTKEREWIKIPLLVSLVWRMCHITQMVDGDLIKILNKEYKEGLQGWYHKFDPYSMINNLYSFYTRFSRSWILILTKVIGIFIIYITSVLLIGHVS